MSRSSRGSASVLFMVVVLPFLFILFVVGIEVSQFLGLREEVQQILDSEAKLSLARAYRSDYVSRRIASRAESLKPYVSLARIDAKQTPRQGTIVVEGAYQGLFTQLVGSLTGGGSVTIPFEISTTVRRTHTSALILLDRVVGAGGVRCGDQNLLRRAMFVTRLVQDLQSFGVESVRVGVVPGVNGEIDILSPTDEVPRCGGFDTTSPFRIASVEGIATIPAADQLAVAYQAVQLLFTSSLPTETEQRAIIMVAPPFAERTEAITATFSLLEAEAGQQNVKVSAVGIAVGGSDNKELFDFQSESGRGKYLRVSEDEATGSDVRVALVHHIQGHTFVAR